jgi:signal transduction histidine kinase
MVQEPAWWRPLTVPAVLGLAMSVAAIVARSPWPLFWSAIALCAEQTVALEIGRRPVYGWALAFAVLLFVGLESAYVAAGFHGRQPLTVYFKSLLPLYALAAGVAVCLLVVSRPVAFGGLGLILVGLGAAMALIVVLALLVLHTRGPNRQ